MSNGPRSEAWSSSNSDARKLLTFLPPIIFVTLLLPSTAILTDTPTMTSCLSHFWGKNGFLFFSLCFSQLYKRQCSPDYCLGWLHLQHLSHFWHIFIFHTDQSIVCVFLCQGSFGALIIGCANIAWGAAANFAAEFLHVLKYCVLACVLHGVLGYCILSRCLFASKTLFSNLRSHD